MPIITHRITGRIIATIIIGNVMLFVVDASVFVTPLPPAAKPEGFLEIVGEIDAGDTDTVAGVLVGDFDINGTNEVGNLLGDKFGSLLGDAVVSLLGIVVGNLLGKVEGVLNGDNVGTLLGDFDIILETAPTGDFEFVGDEVTGTLLGDILGLIDGLTLGLFVGMIVGALGMKLDLTLGTKLGKWLGV